MGRAIVLALVVVTGAAALRYRQTTTLFLTGASSVPAVASAAYGKAVVEMDEFSLMVRLCGCIRGFATPPLFPITTTHQAVPTSGSAPCDFYAP